MDVDRSDPLECILWYHMGMVSWSKLISLSRSATIGQDEVEAGACTMLAVVFKSNKIVAISCCKHPGDHVLSWKLKNLTVFFR